MSIFGEGLKLGTLVAGAAVVFAVASRNPGALRSVVKNPSILANKETAIYAGTRGGAKYGNVSNIENSGKKVPTNHPAGAEQASNKLNDPESYINFPSSTNGGEIYA